MVQTATEILAKIRDSYPYPFNKIMAYNSGLYLGLTEDEHRAYENGELKFKTKYENKRLLQELGERTRPDIPDFPWNSPNSGQAE